MGFCLIKTAKILQNTFCYADTEKRRPGEKVKWRKGDRERREIFQSPKPEPTRWLSGVEATTGVPEKRAIHIEILTDLTELGFRLCKTH
jgi:hypothetical protein